MWKLEVIKKDILNLARAVIWASLLTSDPCARLHWPCLFEQGMGTCSVSWVCQQSGLRPQTAGKIMFLGSLIYSWTREMSCNFPSVVNVILSCSDTVWNISQTVPLSRVLLVEMWWSHNVLGAALQTRRSRPSFPGGQLPYSAAQL